ncbi:DUF4974 domain-containing protein [Pedobacter sp. MC2016-14]|uniref:FecR family protein n=1 Tax=Pedobacter sp. MC2016-14 TaxID=2897327 RepID=UPI001E59AD1D|nr:FecR domain-containing protein [Pedobacter sp. MC2016-14]MCD0490406.1 DUF4974 domain-containing protein [Pedobacter sp. MC2016-14]
MILSFFRRNKLKQQHKAEITEKISVAVENFKENPGSWNEELMGNERATQEKILNRLLLNINNERKNRFTLTYIAKYAAAAVVILGLTLGLMYKDELIYKFSTHAQIIAQTSNTQRKRIALPDGSVAILNVGSKISFPDQFDPALRTVVLIEGEVYFDVKHNDKKPFQVKAGKTLTNVLGTAFNISSYSWLNTINITVTKGKVAVNNQMLLPNQQMVYDRVSSTMEKKKLLASNVVSWMQGGLCFNDEDFKTVATILERKYNVHISFEDQKMEEFHFSARFGAKDKLTDILDDLTLTRGLQYKINQNNITIKN